MKRLLFLTVILSISLLGRAQVFQWANTFNGGGKTSVYQILVSDNGDIFTAGHFTGTIDFDPGDGVLNLTSFGELDAYVAKMDADGNTLWAKQIGGVGDDYIRGMELDPSGNVYCTGSFSESADMNPGEENVFYTSYGGLDMFVVELDNDGNYIWSGHMGSAMDDHSVTVEIASSGNIYLSGYFLGTGDFDPADTANYYLYASGQSIFVEKLAPDHGFLWAKLMGGAGFDYCQDMCLDENENVYTTGMFAGPADFDPGDSTFYLYSVGDRDIFNSKLNSDGEYVWAISMGGADVESGQSIAYDGSGNIYICGNFKGTVDFSPDTTTYYMTSLGDNDIFVGKLDIDANLLWMKQMGGELSDSPYALSLDNQDNVYTTGLFQGSSDFNPGDGEYFMTSFGDYDAFVSKLNANGDFVWAADMGGAMLDRGLAITNSGSHQLFVGGLFTGTADFDPGDDTFYLNANGEYNSFLTKLNTDLLGTSEYVETEYSIFPNPTSSNINIRLPKNISSVNVAVFDILGKKIQEQRYFNQRLISLNLENDNGLLLIQITDGSGLVKTYKIIKN